jgi:cell wall-associated NlpC family hydrolase
MLHRLRLFFLPLGFSLLLLACSGGGEVTRELPTGGSAVNISKARQLLLDEARRWLGVPYSYGGTTRGGVDCSGLVFNVYGKFGVELPRSSRDMFGEGRAVNRGTMLPGDLVFFTNAAGKGITHVGIFVGGEDFIHSSTQRGVITSSLQDVYYRKYYVGARKIIK